MDHDYKVLVRFAYSHINWLTNKGGVSDEGDKRKIDNNSTKHKWNVDIQYVYFDDSNKSPGMAS